MKPNVGIKLLTLSSLPYMTRQLNALKLLTIRPLKTRYQIKKLSQKLYDPLYAQTQARQHFLDKNAQYQLFNFRNRDALCEWEIISDRQIGGSSQGQICLQQNEAQPNKSNCQVKGHISEENRQKLIQIPFFMMSLRRGLSIRIKCFDAIQLEIKSDGLPIHVDLQIQTLKYGERIVTGKIISKNSEWQTYELPIANFRHHQKTFDEEDSTFKDFMLYELQSPGKLIIRNFSIRFLSSYATERNVLFRSLKLVKRRGIEKFTKAYPLQYFYITNAQKEQISENEETFKHMTGVDTGDRVFIKK